MLTIFNRQTLLTTQSGEQFHRAEIALNKAKIKYSVKVRDTGINLFDRARFGSLGRTPGTEYTIYVNSSQIDQARHALARSQS